MSAACAVLPTTAWPPPPHDPRDRAELVTRLGEWELRRFAAGDLRRTYLPMRGMDHVQLWHPSGISVLTPSGLTAGCYEIFPIEGWKRRARSIAEVARRIYEHHGRRFPGPSALASLDRWFLAPGACGLVP